jgi:hypothetical protein
MDDTRIILQLERLGDNRPDDIPDALSQISEGLLLALRNGAAAPALLAALREVRFRLGEALTASDRFELIQLADAAIAKADEGYSEGATK